MVPALQPFSSFRRNTLTSYLHLAAPGARVFARAALLLTGLFATGGVAAAGTLETVRQRGKIVCGVSEDAPGYAMREGKGEWSGLGIDFCKALGVAVFGKADAVTFTPLKRADKLQALRAGTVDLLSGDDAISASADTAQGVHFPVLLAYDGQGFMVRTAQSISSALELSGMRVCVAAAHGDEEGALDYFAGLKIPIQIVKLDRWGDAVQAYEQKTCQVLTGNRSRLAAARARLPAPVEHLMLPELAARQGFGPVVRQGDERWADIVRWSAFAMIAAEGLGVTSANADQQAGSSLPEVRRLLKGEQLSKSLGLEPGWPQRMIKMIGNYGEIYERNLGARSTLRLERQLNNLAGKGGLHFAPSFR